MHEMRRMQLTSACAAVGQPEKGYLAVHRRWRTRLAREGRYLKSGEYVKNRWFCVKAILPATDVYSVNIAKREKVARVWAGKRNVNFHTIQDGNVESRRRCRRWQPPLAAATPAAPTLSFTNCPLSCLSLTYLHECSPKSFLKERVCRVNNHSRPCDE